jgi:hypothetical protein
MSAHSLAFAIASGPLIVSWPAAFQPFWKLSETL